MKPFGHSTTRIDKSSKKEMSFLSYKPCIMFHGFLVLIKIIIKDHEGHVEMFLDIDINMKCQYRYETLNISTSNLIDLS